MDPSKSSPPRFHHDYVDPASWAMELRLRALEAEGLPRVERVPRELRTPQEPPLDPGSEGWRAYWATVLERAPELEERIRMPKRLPHTRKAHELVLHAVEVGEREGPSGGEDSRAALHWAIFSAALEEGRDIGRVDLLVELAVRAGLDRTETRAVLDVDRHAGQVEQLRSLASETGVVGVPTLVRGEDRLQGIHDMETIRAFVTQTTG